MGGRGQRKRGKVGYSTAFGMWNPLLCGGGTGGRDLHKNYELKCFQVAYRLPTDCLQVVLK